MDEISYSELIRLPTFEERYDYAYIGDGVAHETFGSARIFNQKFYRSYEWKKIREAVLIRDDGCDLAMPGYPIKGKILIHHLNPIKPYDLRYLTPKLTDLDNLICVSHVTHNAIHYSKGGNRPHEYMERQPGDTKLW